jgi:hypothetical protein
MELQNTGVDKDFSAKQNSLSALQQHIIDEAEKGNLCILTSLCPTNNKRMVMQTARTKVFPPENK